MNKETIMLYGNKQGKSNFTIPLDFIPIDDIIGFTGTRDGITQRQKEELFELIYILNLRAVHHGGCDGADDQFNILVRAKNYLQGSEVKIHIHPSTIQSSKKFHKESIVHNVTAPLRRNLQIVDAVRGLIACPKEDSEIRRSGTWSTIRYAKKMGKKLIIIYPIGRKVTWEKGVYY